MKAKKPPPVGTRVSINLSLPSHSTLAFTGSVSEHIAPGGLGGRGPGLDVALDEVSDSTLWLIETALASASEKAKGEVKPASPSMEDGHVAADAEGGLVEALEGELKSFRKFNYFQVLDVGYEATTQQIRDSFAELSKRYHPDRFARYESANAKELASEIFLMVRDAYLALASEEGRAKVRAGIKAQSQTAAQKKPIPQKPSPNDAASPKPPQAAKKIATQSSVARAARQSSQVAKGSAVRNPEALKLLEAGQYAEALKIFALAVRKSPTDNYARAGVELAEGLKALADGDRMEAGQRFEAVLDFDPSNPMAARELAKMRRQSTNDRRGALSKLLKRMNQP